MRKQRAGSLSLLLRIIGIVLAAALVVTAGAGSAYAGGAKQIRGQVALGEGTADIGSVTVLNPLTDPIGVQLSDGSAAFGVPGNPLTATISTIGSLVELLNMPGAAADGAIGLPSSSIVMAGFDGANVRTWRMDSSGAGAVIQSDATALNMTEANSAAIDSSVENLDTWNEAGRAAVNAIVGQVGVQGGAGASTALTTRVGIATDDVVSTGIAAIQVDLAAIEILTSDTLTDTNAMVVDLAAIELTQDALVIDAAAAEVLLTTIDADTNVIQGDTTAILADTNAMVIDLAALEVDLAAIEIDIAAIELTQDALVVDAAAAEVLLTTIDADTNVIQGDTTAILADTAAMVIDLAALEVDLAAIEVDIAAIEVTQDALVVDAAAMEVLLTTIDADTNVIQGDTTAMVVDLAAIEVLQTSIEGDTTAIQTAVETIDDWDDGNDRARVVGGAAEGAAIENPITIGMRDSAGNVIAPQVDSDRRILTTTSAQSVWTDSASNETALVFVSGTTLTNSQELVAAVAGQHIVVLELFVSPDTASAFIMRSNTGGTIIGALLNVGANAGASYPPNAPREVVSGSLQTAIGDGLWLDVGTAQTAGGWHVLYTTRQ